VLEVGVGTGRNFAFYPLEARVTGIELSPTMLELARKGAQDLGRDFDLRIGDAQALEFPDASFDTVIFCLTLCSIPDPRRAVAEAKRVLRPAGRIVIFEHVGSTCASFTPFSVPSSLYRLASAAITSCESLWKHSKPRASISTIYRGRNGES
jgi:ubiquinone/menaquinone biosynthesis C-methylase UbiE